MYYDKQGKQIEMLEWVKLLEDKDYKIIKQDILPNEKWVSTVWLGLDHQFGKGNPLFFETMVFFKKGDWDDLDCKRYSTLKEAKKGHQEMIEKHSKKDQ